MRDKRILGMCVHNYGYTNSNYNTLAQCVLWKDESPSLCSCDTNVDYNIRVVNPNT